MGFININNYESYIVDYLEGTISNALKEELKLFLKSNPDIQEEMVLINETSLQPKDITFKEKEQLKKQVISVKGITEENYRKKFIAYYEKELSQQEKDAVEQFVVSNIFLKKEFILTGKVYLKPDLNIIFKNKKALKRKPEKIILWWRMAASIAALLILTAGFLFLFKQEREPKEVKNPKTVVEINTTGIKPSETRSSGEIKIVSGTKIVKRPVNNKSKISTENHLKINTNINTKIIRRNSIEINKLKKSGDNITLTSNNVYERIRKRHLKRYPVNTINRQDKKLISKLIARLFQKAKKEVTLPLPANIKVDKNEPKIARIIDRGVTIFATITGTEPNVSKLYNKNNELISYKISGGSLYLSKTFKKKKY